jgi:hypothetical protein
MVNASSEGKNSASFAAQGDGKMENGERKME